MSKEHSDKVRKNLAGVDARSPEEIARKGGKKEDLSMVEPTITRSGTGFTAPESEEEVSKEEKSGAEKRDVANA